MSDDLINNLTEINRKQYVTISVIEDDNSAIHAILKAIYETYQETSNRKKRIEMCTNLRKELSEKLEKKDPEFFNRSYWESVGYGFFVENLINNMKNVEDGLRSRIDASNYSFEDLKKLLNLEIPLAKETFIIFCSLLKINLAIKYFKNKILLNTISIYIYEDKQFVVLFENENHYETVGLLKNNGIQTWFELDDDIVGRVIKIKNKFESKKEYLKFFRKSILSKLKIKNVETGCVQKYHEIVQIPSARFNISSSDPFVKLLRDCRIMPEIK